MNNNAIRWGVVIITLIVFLFMVNSAIVSLEQQLNDGEAIYLELAPVDPRSLIQGDYMALNYDIENDAQANNINDHYRGQIVASLDENNVAHFERLHTGEALGDNEIVINFYTLDTWLVVIGVDSFLFQEGLAEVYNEARYAEVRIGADGVVMLVDLVDEDRERLLPQTE